MTYKTKGTCSQKIDFRLEDGKIYDVVLLREDATEI